MSKTVVFDFDGVIHSYISGWQGASVIPDPPVPGIKGTIDCLKEAGFKIVCQSTRASSPEGTKAIEEYCKKYNINIDDITDRKPPAFCYVDDRALKFDGDCTELYEKIVKFESYLDACNK